MAIQYCYVNYQVHLSSLVYILSIWPLNYLDIYSTACLSEAEILINIQRIPAADQNHCGGGDGRDGGGGGCGGKA